MQNCVQVNVFVYFLIYGFTGSVYIYLTLPDVCCSIYTSALLRVLVGVVGGGGAVVVGGGTGAKPQAKAGSLA
jgi:hypothetical protein